LLDGNGGATDPRGTRTPTAAHRYFEQLAIGRIEPLLLNVLREGPVDYFAHNFARTIRQYVFELVKSTGSERR